MVASYKYLGHYITYDLSDDDDDNINRQRRALFVQGNVILVYNLLHVMLDDNVLLYGPLYMLCTTCMHMMLLSLE